MAEMQNIQWFPGHMAKAERNIKSQLPLVDAVVEIIDSRIPVSSRNPDLSKIIENKPRIIVLNKCDMADEKETKKWVEFYESQGITALTVDCKTGKGIKSFAPAVKKVLDGKLESYRQKGMVGKTLRVMVVGIPNVGKSTFINRISGGTKAKVENRPGVTKGNQWYSIDKELDLLDTPGVLWPKFEDKLVGEHLAFIGSVKSEVIDIELLGLRICEFLAENYPEMIDERYKLSPDGLDGYSLMCAIGKKRGFVIRGGETDEERTAKMIADEFKNGIIGRITIEKVL